jgi:hypothetical protein
MPTLICSKSVFGCVKAYNNEFDIVTKTVHSNKKKTGEEKLAMITDGAEL